MEALQRSSIRPAPVHVAVIMDGNGRWAQARGLPRTAGHREGANAVRRAMTCAGKIGIGSLNPAAQLDVDGALAISGSTVIDAR